MFDGYRASRNIRLRPSTYVDYVERIRERLSGAAESDPAFQARPVTVTSHGREYRPWSEYMELLQQQRDKIEGIGPPFVTFVHGDPNPENVLVRRDDGRSDIRFIDVKEWEDGDYLFDVVKFYHYLAVTGPVERHSGPTEAAAERESGNGLMIETNWSPPDWLPTTESVIRDVVREFAAAYGDTKWELRWQLGMASNLLGLPEGRLARGRRPAALATYAEGLRYLHEFCEAAELL